MCAGFGMHHLLSGSFITPRRLKRTESVSNSRRISSGRRLLASLLRQFVAALKANPKGSFRPADALQRQGHRRRNATAPVQ